LSLRTLDRHVNVTIEATEVDGCLHHVLSEEGGRAHASTSLGPLTGPRDLCFHFVTAFPTWRSLPSNFFCSGGRASTDQTGGRSIQFTRPREDAFVLEAIKLILRPRHTRRLGRPVQGKISGEHFCLVVAEAMVVSLASAGPDTPYLTSQRPLPPVLPYDGLCLLASL
jgi:hypothetical protein